MDSEAPVRVLVVDDEESIVELVAEYLAARGMIVTTAGDGERALAALDAQPIDVVLTDLRLPVRGGMSLLEAIVERRGAVATVVMTGYGTIETATQALKLGAADYLLKPVRLRELHDALHKALRDLHQDRARRRALRMQPLYHALLGVGPDLAPELLLDLLHDESEHRLACPCALTLSIGERSLHVGEGGAELAALHVGQPPGPSLVLWVHQGTVTALDALADLERLALAALSRVGQWAPPG